MPTISSPAVLRNRLKLRQLHLLAALGEVGTLHKAAAAIGISQPAATRQLHELEELFGVALFGRTSRGLVPTGIGRLLIRHASTFVTGVDKIFEDARSLTLGHVGSVAVGIATGARPDLVPNAVLLLKRTTPRIDVRLLEGGQDDLVAGLKAGRLDLVVGRAPAIDAAHGLGFEALYDEQFSIVCGVANRIPKPPSRAALVRLVDEAWILPHRSTALRQTLENRFVGECGRLPIDVVDSVAIASNLALLGASAYVALMPKAIASYYARRSMLRVLVSALRPLSGTVGVISAPGAGHPPHVVRLVDALRHGCRGMEPARDADRLSRAPKV